MRSSPRRRGATLLELLVVSAIAAVDAGIAVGGAARLADVLAVRGGMRDVRAALWTARSLAVLRATRTAVRFDTIGARVVVFARADTALVRPLRAVYGVRLSATRDSIAYGADGLGYGAANARIVVRRRGAADTLTLSRLGRVR